MAIAITEDHQALGATVADLADKRQLLEANRSLLEASEENLPAAWDEIAKLGWLGLHVPEAYGGSGFGLEELVVVVEELARKVAPGPFVPTVIASAAIAASGGEAACANLLPGLADGSRTAAVALGATATLDGSSVSGSAGVVLGGGLANLLLIAVGDDVAVVEVNDPSVTVETPPNLDPSRRSARVTLDDTPATVLAGGAQALLDLSRVILSADAVGIAAECTRAAAEYAKERIQFGRPIAMFQAVKHHCANMAVATEMATAATWDAARAAATGGDQLSYTAAVAATLAAPAADLCANLNTQVHGGIAITWEHEAHLYLRRATTLLHFLDADGAAADLVDLARRGVTRAKTVTLIQYGTEDQVQRWVKPALDQEVVWCQLFSEPDAGSDAAGVTTKGTRVDGGWLVNGQKVWTSGAHYSGMGFATVRTNPDVPKHDGITMMVIDMHAEGVEVRPLKMVNGGKEFNEVFFSDVFVPDDDVVGPVDGGWTVARATLGNESVSIGSGDGGMAMPPELLMSAYDAHPERLGGGAARLGRYLADHHAMGLLNLRSTNRAVSGSEPGPEGAVTKLVLSELGHDAAAILTELYGPDAVFMDGDAVIGNQMVLMHRALSIAGGTSEIKRNQIGERILGMPRDPLIN
ncbi:MAG: acyl-CoA dehydrogenase [Candidatus Microthrix sp.]|nr:acyl-CoA dehydrogenase [Candidatus Microthrix sp.]